MGEEGDEAGARTCGCGSGYSLYSDTPKLGPPSGPGLRAHQAKNHHLTRQPEIVLAADDADEPG